ncbi:MAG: hypothetical protein A3F54_00165 [Candidatus Kerfeldbacteria bacterium RIFCSPHIGHO2_12_FULL_48_17]|uniref:YprB ribonuclease H-like domain-containing protein n=1 Tax=Candidatus Kerfeldbacteria bacterium RIFCSPHIGHO2_12_FULL_48_17 TaxID=1798542 RepID=A0A1G2B7S3_9BACT|nr:MAG: hypothetical protein A3F54_00165 [Candidatus Kerfeldbacteria bacterium RIFCSPHIGHO2_12_FULL_48_17]
MTENRADTVGDRKIVIDLETKKTFDEVGGHHGNHHLLGISFAGVYSYSQKKYFGFYEKDLPALEKIMLAEKPMIIGFNTISFDNPVLQAYFKHCDISKLPQLDILAEIYKALGFRIKLDNVALATLGEGKSGSGLDAIKYFRTGNWEALTKYCMDDVRITKEVYEYGLRHGQLLYPGGGEIRSVKIPWGLKPTIRDLVYEAQSKHRKLKVKYWEFAAGDSKRQVKDTVIEAREVHGSQIKAFCNTEHAEKNIDMGHILEAELTNEEFAHQSTLL